MRTVSTCAIKSRREIHTPPPLHRSYRYTKVRAYRAISLLDVISKLVERMAAHLIADHLERKRGLQDGQYGCRERRSCVDAVAVLMNRTQQA